MNTNFHTHAASDLARDLLERDTLSGVEYFHRTISILTHVSHNGNTLTIRPVVVALSDSFHTIKTHLETVFQDFIQQGQNTHLYVLWKASHEDTRRNILDEQNVASVMQLIMQRSGVDELVMMLEDGTNERSKAEGKFEESREDDSSGDISPKDPRKRRHSAMKTDRPSTDDGGRGRFKQGSLENNIMAGFMQRGSVKYSPLEPPTGIGSSRYVPEQDEMTIPVDDPAERHRLERRESVYGGSTNWRIPDYNSHRSAADLDNGQAPRRSVSTRGNRQLAERREDDQARRGSHDPQAFSRRSR